MLIGKIAADLAFYGPVLAMYEWRLAGRQGAASSIEAIRRRTTQATRASSDDPE